MRKGKPGNINVKCGTKKKKVEMHDEKGNGQTKQWSKIEPWKIMKLGNKRRITVYNE